VGLLLKGHGDGTFEVVPPAVSGPLATGDVRKLVPITVAGYRCLLVVRNNDRCGLIGLPSMGNKDQR
jgi:hypothetical protein